VRLQSTVYVANHRAKVSHRRGSLLVSSPGGSQRIPLEGIDALLILGGAQITTPALDACARRGVRVAGLRMSGAVRFIVEGPASGNIHLRVEQFAAVGDEERSLGIARWIVAAKLRNSATIVRRWARDATEPGMTGRLRERADVIAARVARIGHAHDGDALRGIEGDAARIHFGAMQRALSGAPLAFGTRTRRPPRDPVNALLGFCYGMLVTECAGAAHAVGLDHQAGFFHRPRSGRPSLALDLAEEFRAMVDRFVVGLVRRRQLSREQFTTTPGGACYLTDDGRSALIEQWERHKDTPVPHPLLGRTIERAALPAVQTTLLARHLRGDLPVYPPFTVS
jgi:CRISPR-associated protein Cas1